MARDNFAPSVASAPTFYTVTGTTGMALAANPKRIGLIISNSGATNPCSIAFDAAAVAGSGITLPANSIPLIFEEGTLDIGQMNAISTAGTNLSIQEFTR